MAPGLDAEIDGLVRAGSLEPAGERVLDAYGDELYGFLLLLVGEAEAGEVFSQVAEDVRGRLAAFSFWCSTRTWLYKLARHAMQFRRSPTVRDVVAVARTVQHRHNAASDRIGAIRDSLALDDRILLTLRIDRELAWEDGARVMIEAESPDAASLARHGER